MIGATPAAAERPPVERPRCLGRLTSVILSDSVTDTRQQGAVDPAREINRNLGETLRARRSEVGFTQGELAERVGLSRASIANIEAGEQAVSVVLLLGLANALDVDAEALLAGARAGRIDVPQRELAATVAKKLGDDEQQWVRGVLPDDSDVTE